VLVSVALTVARRRTANRETRSARAGDLMGPSVGRECRMGSGHSGRGRRPRGPVSDRETGRRHCHVATAATLFVANPIGRHGGSRAIARSSQPRSAATPAACDPSGESSCSPPRNCDESFPSRAGTQAGREPRVPAPDRVAAARHHRGPAPCRRRAARGCSAHHVADHRHDQVGRAMLYRDLPPRPSANAAAFATPSRSPAAGILCGRGRRPLAGSERSLQVRSRPLGRTRRPR
jgi:hypothetical protein